MNKGIIVGDTYYKNVVWNKAVLWKDGELSLPEPILKKLIRNEIKYIVFKERPSMKPHVFLFETVRDKAVYKQVGQEPQFYWSIDLEMKDGKN